MNKKSPAMFTPSGCLTSDSLMLYVTGSLQGAELKKANNHIAECPLCADAVDGLRMWLKENKSGQADTTHTSIITDSQTATVSVKRTSVSSHHTISEHTNGNLLHARTNAINDRIKQRLYTHSKHEEDEEKRLSYKPFVWLAAAATIVLFIGSFFVLWIQNQNDIQKLAQRAEEDRLEALSLYADTTIKDTLVIAMKGNSKLEKQQTNNNSQIAVVADAEELQNCIVLKQDEAVRTNLQPVIESKNEIAVARQSEKSDTSGLNNLNQPSMVSGVVVTAYGITREKKSMGATTMEVSKAKEADTEAKEVFAIVEEMPQFPGGDSKRLAFLSENINYPALAAENGIQGTVYVSFVVKQNGKLSDVKVLRGIGGGCDEEAVRVVKKMPRWIPGKQNGKYVNVLFTMPVIFKLN
jgi:TonB family protein